MLSAELAVCPNCGTVHMEGGAGPRDVDTCANCDNRLEEVELDDLIGL